PGRINDVAYNAAGQRSWLATNNGGLKLDPGDGSLQTFDSSVLGTDRVRSVYAAPNASDNPRARVFAGLHDRGLRWEDAASAGGAPFPRGNFSGQDVTGIFDGDPGDLWVTSNAHLQRLRTLTGAETDFGPRCPINFFAQDVARMPNGDLWLV